MKHTLLTLAAAALINGAMASASFAAACVAGTEDDFTYRGDTASQCEAFGGNDGDPLTAFDESWDRLAKFDGDQDSTVGTIFPGSTLDVTGGEIKFSLKYLGDTDEDGWYEYELLADADPDALLPASMDLVGVVKQGNENSGGGFQAYLFLGATVDDNGNLGTFKSLFKGDNNDFSHFSIYGGNYVPDDNGGGGGAVPEPATLALVGLGLLSAGALRRRRKI